MSEDKKKIIIIHSAAPYEDTKKAIGWVIVIALILVGLVIYAIIQGVIFLAKITWIVIQWIGLAIWFLIKWTMSPIWYPIKRTIYIWNNSVWYEALFPMFFLFCGICGIFFVIYETRRSKRDKKEGLLSRFDIVCFIVIIILSMALIGLFLFMPIT